MACVGGFSLSHLAGSQIGAVSMSWTVMGTGGTSSEGAHEESLPWPGKKLCYVYFKDGLSWAAATASSLEQERQFSVEERLWEIKCTTMTAAFRDWRPLKPHYSKRVFTDAAVHLVTSCARAHIYLSNRYSTDRISDAPGVKPQQKFPWGAQSAILALLQSLQGIPGLFIMAYVGFLLYRL